MPKSDLQSVDEYIASQSEAARSVLSRLRQIIRSAVPEAEEVISYKMPAYKLHGRPILFFAIWRDHYSLYPGDGGTVESLKKELVQYEVSKGTIRFPLAKPIPEKLIVRIAKLRAKAIAQRETTKAVPKKRARKAAK